RARGVWILLDDQVDQAPVLGLLGGHEEVALHCALDLLERALAMLRVNAGDLLTLAEYFLGVDLNVRRLPLNSLAERLVDEDLRMWQRHAHSVVTSGQQDRRPARRQARAKRRHLGADVLHRVVDRERRGQRAARAVDVELDVAL